MDRPVRNARLSAKNDLTAEETAELDEAKRNLRGVTDIEKALNEDGEPPKYLMKLAPNDLGRAIVATGNPDTADNVATLVPGIASNLGGIGGMMDSARNLYEAAESADTAATTSVISWQGYDAPQNVAEAAYPSYAQEARAELNRFQDGLSATDQGQPAPRP